jgi:hypothetical protein
VSAATPDPGALHEPGEAYDGPAVVLGSPDVSVTVRLRGHFEPIDGRFHWFGRLSADPAVTDQHGSGTDVVLRTPHGEAAGRLADLDPWGRFRVTGTGRPPF